MNISLQGKLYIAGLENKIAQLEQELAEIKQQFINYENADAYELDMMVEYSRLQTLIMAVKEIEE